MLGYAKLKPIEQKLQRSIGVGRVSVTSRDQGTWLTNLYQQGCAKIRLPQTFDRNLVEAVLINTAGGIAGGDKLDWEFTANESSNLTITSQACERFYRSDEQTAHVRVSLNLCNRSSLCWLPQETILFNGANAKRILDVNIDGTANLLMVESIVFGRKAMNEKFIEGYFLDRWRIRKNGQLLHSEDLKIDGNLEELLSRKAVMNKHVAMATVLAVTQDCETKLDQAQMLINANGGASFWEVGETGKLLARIVAEDSYELRKILIPVLKLLKNDAVMPKSWAF